MAETLLDRLGFWVQKQLVLNQFPRESWHVGMLQCRDVPIFLEELDKREFLFGVQTIAYMSHLGRFLRGQWDRLAECVFRLDGRLGSLGLGHDQVWVGLSQGLLQFFELCECQQPISSLATLSVIVESPLDVFPDRDDSTRPWHLQD
jgi:hypothetical protein